MAPEVGLEPTTTRLTAACSTIELLWNTNGGVIYKSYRLPSIGFRIISCSTIEQGFSNPFCRLHPLDLPLA